MSGDKLPGVVLYDIIHRTTNVLTQGPMDTAAVGAEAWRHLADQVIKGRSHDTSRFLRAGLCPFAVGPFESCRRTPFTLLRSARSKVPHTSPPQHAPIRYSAFLQPLQHLFFLFRGPPHTRLWGVKFTEGSCCSDIAVCHGSRAFK